MFSSLTIYRITGWPASAAQLEEALAREPFAECAATQQQSVGWVPPREKNGALVETVGGHWIARFAIETKAVPPAAIAKHVGEAAAKIEQDTGRKPGKKERRDLKDDALFHLLPHAFPRRVDVTLWIDPATGLLALGTANSGAADRVISSLIAAADPALHIGLVQTADSPEAAMTAWLSDPETLLSSFDVGRSCDLKGIGESPARVRFANHNLAIDELRQHINEGKLPASLALEWNGRVGFTLTRGLQLKGVKFLDGAFRESIEGVDAFDADVALSTGELAPLIAELIVALGHEAGVENE